MKQVNVEQAAVGMRLDQFMAQLHPEYSRRLIQNWIEAGKIMVNGRFSKRNYRLKEADEVMYEIQVEDIQVVAMPMDLDIVYEDEAILIVNKPKGLIVHPTPTSLNQPTLVHGLLAHTQNLSDLNGELRPGIVHRLDKDTSGLLIVAKTNAAHEILVNDLKEHKIDREYLAIVHHPFPHQHALVDAPIGRDPRNRQRMTVTDVNGKEARTHFYRLENFKDYSYLRCRLETGRTHQIRVHAQYIKHPLVGDQTYGYRNTMKTQGQCLHAFELKFNHPITKEAMVFTADMPEVMKNALEEIRRLD